MGDRGRLRGDGFANLSSGGQTPTVAAGSDDTTHFASAKLTGLSPNTAYRYRILADNGNPGSPVFGDPVSIATRASDAALSHGEYPGPPQSDRAYEMVSAADTSSNPFCGGIAFSTDGERALYGISRRHPRLALGDLREQPLRQAPGGPAPDLRLAVEAGSGPTATPPKSPSRLPTCGTRWRLPI